MEIREEIDETDDPQLLEELKRSNEDKIQTIQEDLRRCFEKEDYQHAASQTARLRYYMRIKMNIDAKLGHRSADM